MSFNFDCDWLVPGDVTYLRSEITVLNCKFIEKICAMITVEGAFKAALVTTIKNNSDRFHMLS